MIGQIHSIEENNNNYSNVWPDVLRGILKKNFGGNFITIYSNIEETEK